MSDAALPIVTEDLRRYFGSGDDVVKAVDGVDLRIEAGEIFGFLGPNGAGKSTTVRMLTTLLRPTSGSAHVAGFDVVGQANEVRRNIGVALQDAAIDPLMTGTELLRLQAVLYGLPKSQHRTKAGELLERVGLTAAADRRVGTYSGGMRRRLDLALSLIHEPSVLFLDEPTTGLDPMSRISLWEEIRRLNDDGTTVLLTTQYLEEADQLAMRIAIIDEGVIVRKGRPADLKAEIGCPTLFVTVDAGAEDTARRTLASFGDIRPSPDGTLGVGLTAGAGEVSTVIRTLDEAGVAVRNLQLHEPSLDDVFAEATGHRLEGAGVTTTTATAEEVRRPHPRTTSTIAQTWAMSKRAILALARQPALVVPSIVFPLFFAALGTASFSRATALPGFPAVDSYLDFALAGAIVQGILFGSTVGATALATDIENGFFDRLLAAPSTRTGILVGRFAGGMAYGAFQTVVFVVVLLPFGLRVKGGVIGVLVLMVGGVILALAVGALMASLAIKTGSSEAVQGAFPLLFIALFFSSAFFPRETMSGVYATLADLNPVSYLVEGMRDLVIEPVTLSAVARAVLIPVALALATTTLALLTLHRRLGAS